jgi:isopentenyldiphosphate isomerase
MVRLEVRLVDGAGRGIGFGDRWLTHRVSDGPGGPLLGQRHVGITIACVNKAGMILVAHRRHRVFDKVWTLAGDTHPYRIHGKKFVEGLAQAARRCSLDDLGVAISGWSDALVLSYSARDPRDPRYCENELLHIMATRYDGPFKMNPKNVYELKWAELAEVSDASAEDLKKEPIERKYAPWVHALFARPAIEVREALLGHGRV